MRDKNMQSDICIQYGNSIKKHLLYLNHLQLRIITTMQKTFNFSLLGFILFMVLVGGCGQDEPVIDVDPEFQEYVDQFIVEAAKHGQTIDFSDTGLSIQFRDFEDLTTGGQCNENHHILIEGVLWETATERYKYDIIFHELGHCELNRAHRNDQLSNDEWASLMRGFPLPEGATPTLNYTGLRKEYYNEELFLNVEAPTPEWEELTVEFNESLNRIPLETEVQEDAPFEEFSPGTKSAFYNNYPGLSDGDFEIEAVLNAGDGLSGIQFSQQFAIGFTNEASVSISSRDNSLGTIFLMENVEYVSQSKNKITVRRKGDLYFLFINETFVYWFEHIPPLNNTVTSYHTGEDIRPEYSSLSVTRLK